jgi:hypothetical protein
MWKPTILIFILTAVLSVSGSRQRLRIGAISCA